MRSWNCAWMSPQMMIGGRTLSTLGSCVNTSRACATRKRGCRAFTSGLGVAIQHDAVTPLPITRGPLAQRSTSRHARVPFAAKGASTSERGWVRL
eukprot:1682647-Pleurochrysis_carterae.AAC.1